MGRNAWTRNETMAFTLIEVMVVVGVLVLLAAIVIAVASGVDNKAKNARVTAQMKTLGDAITAFRTSTNYFPLAVPEDAWTNETMWGNFLGQMSWVGRDAQYFVHTSTADFRPIYNWPTFPTNIHMLAFQLEQNPQASKIFEAVKNTSGSDVEQKAFAAGEVWSKPGNDCEMNHPLGGTRKVVQLQDPWGTPIRYWTGDILKWAKNTNAGHQQWDGDGNSGNTEFPIQQLLATKLQQANWGYILESAGKDGKFGWWGEAGVTLNSGQTEDNVYSVGQ